ncbi:PaaI family thioesterase [Gracilibacillus phocaeensis]|uniref:PaaI family thioesterase n=1 Tax=Gracilibacillus phocaeensis TaxID=2042304 RepID=UPI001031E287|nr:PaaI family thioesterase [Gracilibacillus phocaeensis]
MTLMTTLGMRTITVDKKQVIIEMPVTDKIKQPAGFLHGGATIALAETAASLGGMKHVDPETESIVGIEINCNHIKGKQDGKIIAEATPIHIGRMTMIWSITVTDEKDERIASARCTLGRITNE